MTNEEKSDGKVNITTDNLGNVTYTINTSDSTTGNINDPYGNCVTPRIGNPLGTPTITNNPNVTQVPLPNTIPNWQYPHNITNISDAITLTNDEYELFKMMSAFLEENDDFKEFVKKQKIKEALKK